MIASELISSQVFPLKKNDAAEDALLLISDWGVFSLPVIDGGVVSGFCHIRALAKAPKKEKVIHHMSPDAHQMVDSGMHLFDVIKIFTEYKLSSLTVVENDQFIGIITWAEVIESCGHASLSQPGAVIELQMPARNYTLTEISRLVESNDVKIIHVHIRSLNDDEGHVAVSLKLNSTDVRKVLAAFDRYQYQVTGVFHALEQDESTNARFKNLIKFLDI